MPDQAEILRLTAFTRDPAGGNPAGVVIGRALPDPATMQRIAADIGYSETAFLARDDDTGYRVKYYSPAAEVDFCGHATIAAGVVLGERHGDGTYLLRTNNGDVPVDVRAQPGGTVTATLTSVPPRHRSVPPAAVTSFLEAFAWSERDLDPSIPVAEAYAGAWHLVLALRSRTTLAAMHYGFEDLRALMADRGLTTVQVVWRENPHTFDARNPFPVGGVVEDPATGAAAAALGGYLRDAGLLEAPARFVIRQGEDLGRPSRIEVDVPVSGGIRVTGTAVPNPV